MALSNWIYISRMDSDEEIWNGVDSPSSSNSSTESSGEYEETLMPSGSCFGSCSIEHRDIFLQKKDALIQHHRNSDIIGDSISIIISIFTIRITYYLHFLLSRKIAMDNIL
ncbi:hypothetical protein ACH3XW_12440 [Acanthocheilonema viteae]